MMPTTHLLIHKVRTGRALLERHQQGLRARTDSLEHGRADVERSMDIMESQTGLGRKRL